MTADTLTVEKDTVFWDSELLCPGCDDRDGSTTLRGFVPSTRLTRCADRIAGGVAASMPAPIEVDEGAGDWAG